MPSVTATEFNALNLCDASLHSILWEDNGLDLRVNVVLSNKRVGSMLFRWTTNLLLSIDQGDCGVSPPFTWDVQAELLQNGRLRVVFDFGGTPQGYISVMCDCVEVEGV